MHFRDVPIPERMAHLDRDHRGYPIPVIVLRDAQGKPHFTANAEEIVQRMVREDRCSICGWKNTRRRWFVGGPLSAFHEHGAYRDPPIHAECMRYALKVCPWLALLRTQARIDGRTLTPEQMHVHRVQIETTMIPGKPPVFVCVAAHDHKVYPTGLSIGFKPKRPYKAIEYWRDGQQLGDEEGKALADAEMLAKADAKPQRVG